MYMNDMLPILSVSELWPVSKYTRHPRVHSIYIGIQQNQFNGRLCYKPQNITWMQCLEGINIY